MADISYRLAHRGEEDRVRAFINSHFDMSLPLINRPEFFSYYYTGRFGVPHFVLAERNGQLLSAAGYIPASSAMCPDTWVSVWVAVRGRNGVGLELMNAIPQLLHTEVLACNNIRPATCTFYRFLGWTAGRVSHYYRLAARDEYRLAVPGTRQMPPVSSTAPGALTLARVANDFELNPLGMPDTPHTPRKDTWYLRRRYFHYPHQTYDVWAVRETAVLKAYVVTRTVPACTDGTGPEVPVVRIVDFIGRDEVLPRIGAALDRLLQESGAEYMDCYCAGIPSGIWAQAGFCERLPDDGTVIPNYLNPPLHENTEYYYFTSNPQNFVLFKADGDQDRPNLT